MRTRSQAGFTLIELMIVVAIISVLAAVAIPSFMRYIAKSKTTEARQNLRRIYEQSRVYYLETYGARAGGAPVPHQFPASEAMTPALYCCTQPGGKCAPDASLWTSETWTSLHFSVPDPHYYQYEYVASGVSTSSIFTARAQGDLDCDGIESTFEMYGRSGIDGSELTGSGGIFRLRDTE